MSFAGTTSSAMYSVAQNRALLRKKTSFLNGGATYTTHKKSEPFRFKAPSAKMIKVLKKKFSTERINERRTAFFFLTSSLASVSYILFQIF